MAKNILIVGASSGIGQELAKQLITQGYQVYSASRHTPTVSGIVQHILFDANTTTESNFTELPTELHGLVYCAGTINLKPFQRLQLQDFENDFRINLLGAVDVIQKNIARLKASKSASVVLFSTVAVQLGMGFHASVAAAKGAVEGLTHALAAEYASSNIRFNAIAPSLTATPLAQSLLATEEKTEASAKRHPLNRVGESHKIASMAKWLLSDEADWTTGKIFTIDGGIGNLKV